MAAILKVTWLLLLVCAVKSGVVLSPSASSVWMVRGSCVVAGSTATAVLVSGGGLQRVARHELSAQISGHPAIDYNPTVSGRAFLPCNSSIGACLVVLDTSACKELAVLTTPIQADNVFLSDDFVSLVLLDNANGHALRFTAPVIVRPLPGVPKLRPGGAAGTGGTAGTLFSNPDLQAAPQDFRYRASRSVVYAAVARAEGVQVVTVSQSDFHTVSRVMLPWPSSATVGRVFTVVVCPKGAPDGSDHVYVFYGYNLLGTRHLDMAIFSHSNGGHLTLLQGTPFTAMAQPDASALELVWDYAAADIPADTLGVIISNCTSPSKCHTLVAGIDVVRHAMTFCKIASHWGVAARAGPFHTSAKIQHSAAQPSPSFLGAGVANNGSTVAFLLHGQYN